MKGVLLLLLCCFSLAAQAATVTQKLGNGLVVRADYRKAAVGKPAVIVLHGFLQTHEFPTGYRLAEGINADGFTVLAPTLSLGVTHRQQSLACEAIHAHTMQDAVDEIGAWVRWLKKRHKGPIMLVSHSFGSVEALAYLSGKPDPAITRFIGISIIEGRLKLSAAARERLMAKLKEAVRTGTPRVVTHQFSYCPNYLATPAGLLSYLEWTPTRVLDAASHLRPRSLYIMGGQDERLGEGWVDLLAKHNRVNIIEGANHFMDGEHEFDLLDAVLKELNAF